MNISEVEGHVYFENVIGLGTLITCRLIDDCCGSNLVFYMFVATFMLATPFKSPLLGYFQFDI